ncbi:MAG: transglycosylase SLT domain-containing protein [Pseudomonadota bacterium]
MDVATDPWAACGAAAAAQEAAFGVPDSLLHSIALAESGRRNPNTGEATPWPGTVMAERRGRYLPNKAAAIAEVRGLQARGVRNIDVGCMQVNLHHHGDAFPNLETAFDPMANAEYAATFLTALHDELDSWTRATGFYHSRTSGLYQRYRKKVLDFWIANHTADDAEAAPAAPATLPDAVPKAAPAPPIETAALAPDAVDPPALTEAEIAERRLARMRLLRAAADARRGMADAAIARSRATHAATMERQRALLETYRERLNAISEAMRSAR